MFDTTPYRVLVWVFFASVTPADASAALDEIRGYGLCTLYAVADSLYVLIPSFTEHQVINKPTRSKLPPYRPELAYSGRTPVGLPEDYGRTTVGSEGSEGKERIGSSARAREGKEDAKSPGPDRVPARISSSGDSGQARGDGHPRGGDAVRGVRSAAGSDAVPVGDVARSVLSQLGGSATGGNLPRGAP